MHYSCMLRGGKRRKKSILGSRGQEFGVRNEISRFLSLSSGFWADLAIGFGSFEFEQLPAAAAQSIFQIEKTHSGSL